MPRSLVFLILFIIVVIAAMFFLASMDVKQDQRLVEKPVLTGATN